MTVYQVTHKMRWQSQEMRNVYYYETITGDPSASEWQDIVDEIRADFVSELQSDMDSDWSFYGIDYREVDTAGLPTFSVTPTSGSLSGSSGGTAMPAQIALVVSAQANSTKPRRVRTYYTGYTENGFSDGLWGSAVVGRAESFFDFQSVLNAAGTNELQRVSVQWNTSHTVVTAFNNVAGSAGVGADIPATQRRRRIGVGI